MSLKIKTGIWALLCMANAFVMAQEATTEKQNVVSVNGQNISASMLSLLEKSREQGPLSGFSSSRKELVNDLLTTELLYQQAIDEKLHELPVNRVELELARKTLLSQIYVRDFVSKLDISEDQMRSAYRETSGQAMVQMEYWNFESKAEAEAFLQRVKVQKARPEIEAEFEPWQMLSEFSFGNMKHARDLAAGDWLNIPVETVNGWQVWRCVERSEIPKPSYEDAREGLRQEIGQKMLQKHIAELKGSAAIVFAPEG